MRIQTRGNRRRSGDGEAASAGAAGVMEWLTVGGMSGERSARQRNEFVLVALERRFDSMRDAYPRHRAVEDGIVGHRWAIAEKRLRLATDAVEERRRQVRPRLPRVEASGLALETIKRSSFSRRHTRNVYLEQFARLDVSSDISFRQQPPAGDTKYSVRATPGRLRQAVVTARFKAM